MKFLVRHTIFFASFEQGRFIQRSERTTSYPWRWLAKTCCMAANFMPPSGQFFSVAEFLGAAP